MAVVEAVSVDDLLALWHGDEDACGYWHPSIVIEVCRLTRPASVDVVRARFYPGQGAGEVPEFAGKLIALGFTIWARRRVEGRTVG